jgi:hypothetical protein
MRMAMKNNRSFLKSNLLALTVACFALAAFGCTKSDSLGGVGVADGGPDGGGKDIIGCQSSGAYSSKCDAPQAPEVSSNSDSGSDTPYVPAAAVCDQLAAAARAQVESYLQSTSFLACQVDSDCSLLYSQSLNCFFSCKGQPVATADIAAVTDATSTACDEYFAMGCPAIFPSPCPPIYHAICERGMCASDAGSGQSGSADAAVDAGIDSPVDAGDPVDGGAQDGGTIQCDFLGFSQDLLTCADREYCLASPARGGGVFDSGVSYACEPFPEACLADRSCACVCNSASSSIPSQCAVRGQQCNCSVSQGILTLLCAIP